MIVTVQLGRGSVDIPAIPTATPGLVIHGRVLGDGSTVPRGEWKITHVRSGKSLSRTTTSKKNALAIARELIDTDWERSEAEVMRDKPAARDVVTAYRRVLG